MWVCTDATVQGPSSRESITLGFLPLYRPSGQIVTPTVMDSPGSANCHGPSIFPLSVPGDAQWRAAPALAGDRCVALLPGPGRLFPVEPERQFPALYERFDLAAEVGEVVLSARARRVIDLVEHRI